MPSFNDTYGGPALKPEDVKAWGGTVKVTINDVEMSVFTDQNTGQEKKQFIMRFQEVVDKIFYLNKLNGTVISAVYGDNTDYWMNKPLILNVAPGSTPDGIKDRIFVHIPPEMQPAPVAPPAIPNAPAAQIAGPSTTQPGAASPPPQSPPQAAQQPQAPMPAAAPQPAQNLAPPPPAPPVATPGGQPYIPGATQPGATLDDLDDDIPF